jgi:hypothetical protein
MRLSLSLILLLTAIGSHIVLSTKPDDIETLELGTDPYLYTADYDGDLNILKTAINLRDAIKNFVFVMLAANKVSPGSLIH